MLTVEKVIESIKRDKPRSDILTEVIVEDEKRKKTVEEGRKLLKAFKKPKRIKKSKKLTSKSKTEETNNEIQI